MAKRKKKLQPLLPPLAEGELVSMPERLEQVAAAELVPYARNARTHSQDQVRALQASIREYGFISPVVIDSGKNILAGHGRVLAAQALGLERVPCVYAEHLTEAQRRAYILADNRLAEMAGWDMDLVAGELEELAESGEDVRLTGFELENLAADGEPPEAVPESSTKSEKLVTCPSCGCEFSPTRRRK